MIDDLETRKRQAVQWFETLRNNICAAFEQIEHDHTPPNSDLPAGKFARKSWQRHDGNENERSKSGDGGGGTMALMRGRVFEKVGVNISEVFGTFSAKFRSEIPGASADGKFWAAGISLVAHMHSPKIPAVHMNTRFIVTSGAAWFGGGADLNPIYPNDADTQDFHARLKQACDAHDPNYYPRFKAACDSYFHLPHRDEARGVGGIFYDQLNSGNWSDDFDFTRAVGTALLDIFPKIVRRHVNQPWDATERDYQLVRRGRYAEFNLIYDRGTRFGLMTGGNPEAILMSLPPMVKWP